MLRRSIDVGDVTLAVLEGGVGGHPLLLVHGFTGLKEDFADEIEPLAALGYHVVAPDLRGHGESSKPTDEAAYSYPIFVADLWALATALGWDRFDLLGHSMGGMVAQLMVLEDLDRISRLVLMDTHHSFVSTLTPELVEVGVDLARTQGLDVIVELLKMFEDVDDGSPYQRLCRERAGYREWSESKTRTTSPAMYAAILPTFINGVDRLEQLREIDCPTLVMVGEHDEAFVGGSKRMAEVIPNAQLAVLADGGHCPQFEATGEWRAALYGFLAEASAHESVA